jgi:hypothetical protein
MDVSRPLHPRERASGPHLIGDWLSCKASLDDGQMGQTNCYHYGESNPRLSNVSLHRTEIAELGTLAKGTIGGYYRR